MSDLPDPATIRDEPAPPGWHYEWAVCDNWRAVDAPGSRACRWMSNQVSCRAPSVAKMWRVGTVRPSWWHYCADHLYGRYVADGQVWFIRTVQDTDG